MTILKGHVSPETAYLVDDYPYGFRLRCKIRYWIEYKEGKGCRFWSQTSNPKRGNVWNKPKAGTYSRFGACMLLDDVGHVQCVGLGEYSNGAEALAWKKAYDAGVPPEARPALDAWVNGKLAYDAARAAQPVEAAQDLRVGLEEAHKAWLDVAIKQYEP